MTESKIVTTDGNTVLAAKSMEGGVGIAVGEIMNRYWVFMDRANATLLHEALGRALAKEG